MNVISEFEVVPGTTTLAELQRWLAGVNAPPSSLVQVWGTVYDDGSGSIEIGETK